jgi:hypothetical protein
MGTVLTFLRAGTVFEPAEVAALCKAYDKACAKLHFENKPPLVKEALAAEIIALASCGECDPDYLCDATLDRIARGH